jgi:Carboxypeptidase regulatory-like domain
VNLLAAPLVLLAALHAQDPRGTIAGRVVDRSGAVVPRVVVRATNAGTSVTTRATANDQGYYEIPYLLAGTYTVGAEHAGFKGWSKPSVDVRMGDGWR